MTTVKIYDIVTISDNGRALNRVKVINMVYIDLRRIKNDKVRRHIIINAAYGASEYDYIRLDDYMYIMSARAICKIYSKINENSNIRHLEYLITDVESTGTSHLFVRIIGGVPYSLNYINVLVVMSDLLLDGE